MQDVSGELVVGQESSLSKSTLDSRYISASAYLSFGEQRLSPLDGLRLLMRRMVDEFLTPGLVQPETRYQRDLAESSGSSQK